LKPGQFGVHLPVASWKQASSVWIIVVEALLGSFHLFLVSLASSILETLEGAVSVISLRCCGFGCVCFSSSTENEPTKYQPIGSGLGQSDERHKQSSARLVGCATAVVAQDDEMDASFRYTGLGISNRNALQRFRPIPCMDTTHGIVLKCHLGLIATFR